MNTTPKSDLTDLAARVEATADEKIAQRVSELVMDRIWSTFEFEDGDPPYETWLALSEGIYDDALRALAEGQET